MEQRIEELENEVKKCKELLGKYQELFDIEDGKVFVNSSVVIRGEVGSMRSLSLHECVGAYMDVDKVYDLKKMNREDYKQHAKEVKEYRDGLSEKWKKEEELRKKNRWFNFNW
jgi:hypothetical protein